MGQHRNTENESTRLKVLAIYGVSRVMHAKVKAIAKRHYGLTITELSKKLFSEIIDKHPNIKIDE